MQSGLTVLIGMQKVPAAQSDGRTGDRETAGHGRLHDWIVLLAVMLLGSFFVGSLLRIGWIPNDEGTLAQSAIRVYQGQLPQREFAECYTGGLSFIHALAFRLFGINLFSLRLSAFLFFIAWLPTVYYVARRFVAPVAAGVVTLAAVGWSYPNYVAAMPSWYNLFFATFGAACLLRYLEVQSRHWLFLAGVCGGASVLVKVIGFYYVAAVLLFLFFVEQSRQEPGQPGKSCRSYRVVCVSLLAGYLAVLLWVIWPQLGNGEVYQFFLPSAACVALLLWRERRPCSASSRERFARLFSLVVPFILGIAVIIGIYLIPYFASGSVLSWVQGVTNSTSAHMSGLAGRQQAPSLKLACLGLMPMALIVFAMYAGWARNRVLTLIVAAGLAAALANAALAAHLDENWLTAGTLTPLIVLLGATLILAGPRWGTIDVLSQQRIMLLVSLAAVCSLVQYPFSYVTYFCYTAPLSLLAVVASVSARRNPPGRFLLAMLLLYFACFGFLVMVPKHIYNPDLHARDALQALRLPRAGALKVDVTSSYVDATTSFYEELIPFLQAHSPNGLMYAGNDCPELYFLSGLKNPTRDDSGAPASEVLMALRSGQLRLAVINDKTFFAGGVTQPALRSEIARVLPNMVKRGRFSIYWR